MDVAKILPPLSLDEIRLLTTTVPFHLRVETPAFWNPPWQDLPLSWRWTNGIFCKSCWLYYYRILPPETLYRLSLRFLNPAKRPESQLDRACTGVCRSRIVPLLLEPALVPPQVPRVF